MARSDNWEVPEELKTGSADDVRLAGNVQFVQTLMNKANDEPPKRNLDQIICEYCLKHAVSEAELTAPRRTRATAGLRTIIATSTSAA